MKVLAPLFLLFLGIPYLLASLKSSAVVAFLICLVIMALILGKIGKLLTTRWPGILIDPARKRFSLSRFQVALWTWIVFSALYVFFVYRVLGRAVDPLNIVIPDMILIILGISLTVAVGAPIIEKEKADRTEDDVPPTSVGMARSFNATSRSFQNTLIRSHEKATGSVPGSELTNRGVVVYNEDINKAEFLDIFKGIEVGDYHLVDISKVQNFFITLILAVAYFIMLLDDFSSVTSQTGAYSLPEFTGYAVTLLGISHAAYLANKSFTKSNKL